MLTIFSALREFTLLSIALRMFLSMLCGGMIGLERTYRRRPAGMRTHMLICLGAAMTTMTSQYLLLYMNYFTDMARLGAQVVAGIGFIGAGTIIVTRHQKVRGLTTAAGLWTCAIVGLALGAGFFEGALAVTALVMLAEIFFSRLEHFILDCNTRMIKDTFVALAIEWDRARLPQVYASTIVLQLVHLVILLPLLSLRPQ